eukprot:CAMPEP_0178982486 /NCGR_PEP_ID=MMETSP0795-20121207/523_1 /TAXON_ID=88552 /ORGANISM="Amoebophrya sp., Strain Ameob2" /LENGTH=53 /DNA_ID=CAMNT_0020673137 /DNA_START=928 /DNA_END=1089 /DNA_ORIENTATION=+
MREAAQRSNPSCPATRGITHRHEEIAEEEAPTPTSQNNKGGATTGGSPTHIRD